MPFILAFLNENIIHILQIYLCDNGKLSAIKISHNKPNMKITKIKATLKKGVLQHTPSTKNFTMSRACDHTPNKTGNYYTNLSKTIL